MNKAAKRIWAFVMAICMICTMGSAMGEVADCEHEWQTVATLREGTCETAGVYKDECSECGEVRYVNKLGHKFEMDFVDATCEEPQMYGEVCSECGETNGEMTAVDGSEALGHKWDEVFLDASCENPAGVQKTCERCDKFEFIAFEEGSDGYEPQKDHTPVAVDDVAATCKSEGWSGKVVCAVCGHVVDEGTKIDIDETAHKPVVTTILKEGNCKTGTHGIGKMACELCGVDMSYGTIPYEHAWVDDVKKAATCAEDGEMDHICALCGLEEKGIVIPATGKHDYVETFIDATCTEPAMYGEICSVCEGVKGELKVVEGSEALGHEWEEDVIEAGCQNAAGVLKTCLVCGEKELFEFTGENAVAALGHKGEAVEDIPATCKTTGWTGKVICSVCGEVTVEGEEVPVNEDAHKIVVGTVLKAADCANKANGIGKMVCELCGEEMDYGIIKFEHAWVDTILEAATCTEDGLKNRECTVCGEIEEEVVIPATGEHDYVETFIDANCTEPAKYGTICVVCGLAKGDLKVVEGSEALGHEWEEDVIEAGCQNAAGVLKTCLVCGEKELVEFTGENAVAALGHKEVAKDIAATCHATGTEGRTVCERCGEEIVAGTEVEINPDNHVLKEDGILVEATCSKAGIARYVCEHGCEYVTYKAYYADHAWSAEKVDNAGTCVYKECTVCGTIEIIETIVEADCENHTFVDVKGFAATDTKDGLTDGKKCSKCGLILYGCEKIPMITCVHEAGEVVIENEVQPTCAKEGSFDEVVYCTLCEEEISRETKSIEKVAHTEEVVPGKAATCTEAGLTDGIKCSVCGEVIKAQEETELGAHTEEVVPGKAATCTEAGLTDGIKCSVCGEVIKAQEEIPALGAESHIEEIIPAKEATCKEAGLTEGVKCSVCGAIIKAQEEIPALAHTEVVIEGKAPTCTEAGYAESKICSVCETVIAEATEIPALGHTEFVVPGKAATCTESGLSDGKICEVCFAVLVEQTEIPALGHTEEIIPGTSASCGESGLTDGIKCSVCGEILKAQEEVTVAHSYSVSYDFNEDYTKKLKIYTCTECGYTYSEEEDF